MQNGNGEKQQKAGDAYGVFGTLVTILKYLAIPASIGAAWAMVQGDVKTVKESAVRHELKIEDHEKRIGNVETEARVRFANIDKKLDEQSGDIKEILRRMPRRGDRNEP